MKAVLLVAVLGLSVCTVGYRRASKKAMASAEEWKRVALKWKLAEERAEMVGQFWQNSATNLLDTAQRAVDVAEFWRTNGLIKVQITITNNPAFDLPRAYERSQPSSL